MLGSIDSVIAVRAAALRSPRHRTSASSIPRSFQPKRMLTTASAAANAPKSSGTKRRARMMPEANDMTRTPSVFTKLQRSPLRI
jgi:hypothetical protein